MARLKGFEEWYCNPFRFISRSTPLQKIIAIVFIIMIVGIIKGLIELILAAALVLIIFIGFIVLWLRDKLG